jgi:hypothetical protein
MKILIIQENGRHEANRNYRECFCFERAFKRLQINDVTVWGLGHDNYESKPDYNSFDLIINLENYDETGWLSETQEQVAKSDAFKMLWSIDAHCRGEELYEQYFKEGNYNILLHSTKDFVKKPYHRWLPNCYDDTLIKSLWEEKKYFLGFCGNESPTRTPILNYFEKLLKNNFKKDIFVIGDEMVKAINSYMIHFNINVGNDINYRSFETIGCGTILLTNDNYQYKELGFVNGYNYISYNSLDEIPNILEYYSKKGEDLDSIAQKANVLARKHTYVDRVKMILDFYNE